MNNSNNCRWCGALQHQGTCPRVKSIEFHQDGVTVKHVEFWDHETYVGGVRSITISSPPLGSSTFTKFAWPTEETIAPFSSASYYHAGGVAS